MQFACRIERAEKCIKQSALIAAKNAKFHSNPTPTDQFTAEIVGRKEDNREDVDIRFRYCLNLAAKISASIFSKRAIGEDEYACKVARIVKEACNLVEVGF